MIFVHGALRNANAYFCEGSSAVASRGGDVKARTLVVAPWYGTEQLSAEEWMGRGNGTSTRWTNNSWIQGGDTRGKPKRFSTSFDIMDQLVRLLLDGAPLVDGAKLYPRLDHVVIVGFSAGAQFAFRYSFFAALDTRVRYLLSDAATWMYFSPERPAPRCTLLHDSGVSHACVEFGEPDVEECTGYNNYKYGLGNLSSSESRYVERFADDQGLLDDAVELWADKDVRFVFGQHDTCNAQSNGYDNARSCFQRDAGCYPVSGDVALREMNLTGMTCCDTFPASNNNVLDVNCEAMLTGSNRLQRGLNHMNYLTHLYSVRRRSAHERGRGAAAGPSRPYTPRHSLFAGAHSDYAFYQSKAFVEWAFPGELDLPHTKEQGPRVELNR